jgi:iron complex outermembrane receptor protein
MPKPLPFLFAVCASLLLTAAPASAQGATAATAAATSATGAIAGRVLNVGTGQYLTNARVTVKGTSTTVFTDKDGSYRIAGVPSGPATLEVFFTDLDLATAQVLVPAGGTVQQDINLTSVARYGQTADGTVRLDAFVVAQERETDAQAIATNEQRFAPNIKNVLSTDSLGDVLGGSVGEFMKFLPGVTVESDLADVSGVSIRGIGGGMTSVTNDGAPASNIWTTATRSVDVRSMALNDIARMEVSKVPTPANPADSLAGSINLVSKSAFERSGRQLRYSLNLIGNHENLDLKKTPHSHGDKMNYKIYPGVSLDFTWPVNKRFGVVIAANHSRAFNEQHRTLQTWSSIVPPGSPAGTTANYANPLLNALALLDGPRDLTRNTLSVKADWKITDNGVLSIGHVASRTDTRIGSLTYTWNTSTTATSSIAGGRTLAWDGSQTLGATGRGTLNNNGTNQLINQITDTSNVGYRYDNGRWRVESGVSRSASQTKRRYFDAGFFLQASAIQRFPVRISFLDLAPGAALPGRIEVFDNTNQPVDWNNPANLRGNTANNSNLHNRSYTNQGFLNVRRTLDFLPVPTALQAGVLEKRVMLDTNIRAETWTFMGPNGASTTTAPIEPYLMQRYKGVDTGYGMPSINWMSPSRAFRAFQLNPLLYQQTDAQRASDRNSHIDNNENIKETVQAAYLQADTRLFSSRLRLLGGLRFERTVDRGIGGLVDSERVWQRNPDGSFVRNAAGQRVRRPEAGAAGSITESLLIREYRASFTRKEYDGSYPSLHATFNAAENLLLRAAWAKTYGRPNYADIIPRTVANTSATDPDEDDDLQPNQYRGTLTIRNPALMPWTADNFDLSAEYYTEHGGLISGGLFLKELRNFFGDSSRRATPELLAELGLPDRYLDWNINSKFNSGDARITGAEINVRQNLRRLGRWGGYFTLFGNATRLELDGNPGASFSSFIPKSANWGFTFAMKRVTFTARWNYRGLDKRLPLAAYGPNGYEYIEARTVLDVNGSYQLTKTLSFVASANNIFNQPYRFLRYGDLTPSYARLYAEQEYGIQMAIGLRGTF